MKYNMWLMGVVILLLVSCGGQPESADVSVSSSPTSSQPESQPAVQVSSTPQIKPTETISPTNTALPEGVIFRDDFNGSFQDGWVWEEEDPAKWTFVNDDGEQWLQIIGNAGRSNVLKRDLPEGDFAIIAHIKADPHLNFHQANIFVFQDPENYIVMNTGYCGPCPVGGFGYFMETVVTGGDRLNHYELPRNESDLDVYLKIEVANNIISGYYATQPGEWNRIGRFGNFYDLNSIGLSATNSSPPDGTPEDIIARFDYFEVIEP